MVLLVLLLPMNLLVSRMTLVIALLYVFSLLVWLKGTLFLRVFYSWYIWALISSIYFERVERTLSVSRSIFFYNSRYMSSLRFIRFAYFWLVYSSKASSVMQDRCPPISWMREFRVISVSCLGLLISERQSRTCSWMISLKKWLWAN